MTTSQNAPLHAYPFVQAPDAYSLGEALETRLGARFIGLARDSELAGSIANSFALQRSSLWYCAYATPLRLRFQADDYLRVQFNQAGLGATRSGSRVTAVTPTQACISWAAAEIEFGDGYAQTVWRISRQQLTQLLATLLDEPVTAGVDFDCAFDLAAPDNRTVTRLMDLTLASIDNGMANAMVLPELEQAMLVAFLCTAPHNHRDRLQRPAPTPAPWQVHRAEAYIEAHWNQPITIETLVAVTGASARSIFRAFRQSRGCTPLEFARRVRLQNARRMLQAGNASGTITEIALACGFSDPGHFSKEFRKAFGETPSSLIRSPHGGRLRLPD